MCDPATFDTLLEELNADWVEERAVREAFAAARSHVEGDIGGDAILQAIDEAERDLHLVPAASTRVAPQAAGEDKPSQPVPASNTAVRH